MARQLRIQYPGAFYHITSRGNDRQNIYRDQEDYLIFLDKLKDSLEVYNISLLGYVCMTNHFHLLLTTPDGNLSEFMRHFNISYTSAFNSKYNRSGHLYQGRYKSFLIDADSYLTEVSRYLHLNPVRIKKYSKLEPQERIRILNGNIFNSFTGYSNTRKRYEFINYSTILDYFGGDSKKGRQAYRQFVYKGLTSKIDNPLEIGRGNRIIGNEDFVSYINETFLPEIDPVSPREQPDLKEIRSIRDPEKCIELFCKISDIEREDLCCRGKNITERSMLMELLYRFCNIKQPEIGRLVGNIDYSAVSISRKRLRLKMEKDSFLKKRFEKIIKEIMGSR